MVGIMVVDAGLAIVTNLLKLTGTEPKYVHWGTGTMGPVEADTILGTARAEARTSGTSTRVQTNTANDTYQVVGVIVCTTTAAAITEVGLFDTSVNGNLFLRATFLVINLAVGDSIEFTLKAVFNQA